MSYLQRRFHGTLAGMTSAERANLARLGRELAAVPDLTLADRYAITRRALRWTRDTFGREGWESRRDVAVMQRYLDAVGAAMRRQGYRAAPGRSVGEAVALGVSNG